MFWVEAKKAEWHERAAACRLHIPKFDEKVKEPDWRLWHLSGPIPRELSREEAGQMFENMRKKGFITSKSALRDMARRKRPPKAQKG